MNIPIKFENDSHEHSRAEKIIIVTVLFIVALVMISWAADGFASLGIDVPQAEHGVAKEIEYSQGYNTGVKDWCQFNTNTSRNFEGPFSHTTSQSDYDTMLQYCLKPGVWVDNSNGGLCVDIRWNKLNDIAVF